MKHTGKAKKFSLSLGEVVLEKYLPQVQGVFYADLSEEPSRDSLKLTLRNNEDQLTTIEKVIIKQQNEILVKTESSEDIPPHGSRRVTMVLWDPWINPTKKLYEKGGKVEFLIIHSNGRERFNIDAIPPLKNLKRPAILYPQKKRPKRGSLDEILFKIYEAQRNGNPLYVKQLANTLCISRGTTTSRLKKIKSS